MKINKKFYETYRKKVCKKCPDREHCRKDRDIEACINDDKVVQ